MKSAGKGSLKKPTPSDVCQQYLEHCQGVSESARRAAAECSVLLTDYCLGHK
jgi:hypothetical protein